MNKANKYINHRRNKNNTIVDDPIMVRFNDTKHPQNQQGGGVGSKNDNFEKVLLETVDACQSAKQSSQIYMIHAMHAPDANVTMPSARSSMDTVETTDLCLFLLANRSPSTKDFLSFSQKVAERNVIECEKLKTDLYSGPVAKDCAKDCKNYIKQLKKLKTIL